MRDTINCLISICYENEEENCICNDYEEKEDLIPDNEQCSFFFEKFKDGDSLSFSSLESLKEFLENHEKMVKVFTFDEDSLEVLYKKFKVNNETKRFFIRVNKKDQNKFEFRISVDNEIFSVDKNQADFYTNLMHK